MASSSAPITHFEIYVLDRKRWTLQVRYRHDQKDEALEEARNIEKHLNIAVKVMRETYHPDTNSCEEVTVYLSQKIQQTDAPMPALRAAVRSVESFDPEPPPRKAAERSTGLMVFELLVIIIVAITIATAASSALPKLVWWLGDRGYHINPANYPRLVFGAFAGTFLLVAVPLTLVFLGNVEEDKARKARAKAAPPRPPARTARTAKPATEGATAAAAPAQAQPAPPPPAAPLRRAAVDLFVDMFRSLMRRPATQTQDEPPPQPEPAPEPPPAEVPAAEPPPAPVVEEKPPLPPGLERHRMTAIRFMGEAVLRIKAVRPQLDAYNRFGINLVMAGAVDSLAAVNQIDDSGKRRLLGEVVEMLGSKAKLADAFCDKLEEYVLEPRYMQMVQLGRDMMERFLGGDGEALGRLPDALEGWNKPTPKQTPQRIVTVMFTDMVGSTDLTQAKGDLAAQELVRRHNSIVRNALAEFDGREVKHTGDGIMASFASTANAVDAAIAIQRAVHTYNEGEPSVTVHLRVGINAGEPIEEEDDLFGTTVQLAARVCAKAESDQILCSNVVRELSAGKGRRFITKGDHDLKGFREPVALHEVVWHLGTAGGVAEIGAAVPPEPAPAQAQPEPASEEPKAG